MLKATSTTGMLHLTDRKVGGVHLPMCGISNSQRYAVSLISDEDLNAFTAEHGADAIRRCKKCFGS